MLTGHRPFPRNPELGETAQVVDIFKRVEKDEVLPPRRLCPDLPHDLEAICMKCLQKEPTLRYADGQALADALHCFLAGQTSFWKRIFRRTV